MSLPPILSVVKRFLFRFEREEATPPLYPKNFLILLGVAFLVVVPYAGILSLLDVDQFDHKMEDFLEKYKFLIILAAVILAPFLEEVAFRFHLRGEKTSIWVSFFVSLIFISEYWWINATLSLYFIHLLYQVYQGITPSTKWMVIGSSIGFGLIHMGNFSNFNFAEQFYWIPLLVGVQTMLGFLLAFLRIHYGTWHAIAFHAAYNGVAVAIAVIGETYYPEAF